MKLGQTGKFYTTTIFAFLILSSVLTIVFHVEGELSGMYSVLFAQTGLLLALMIGVAVLAFSRKKQGLKPFYIPFLGKNKGKHDVFAYLLMPVLSFILVYGFNDINEVVLYLFSLIGLSGSSIGVFWTTPGYLVLALLLVALTPAIVEELFIRGYCLDGLGGLKNIYAILISALLFSVMHMNPAQTVYQFLLGVVLALVVKIGGKLTYSICLHFCNNAIVLLATYFSKTTESATVTLPFALWSVAYAVAGVIGVLTVLFLFAYLFKRKDKESSEPTTLRWFAALMKADNGDVTAATKAEKITFWVFFAIIVLVWILNTILM